MGEDNGVQLQSSLGEQVDNKIKSDRNWNNGFLAFGKVLKVHHKRMTADVQLYGTGDQIVSEEQNEGLHSCRIGVTMAGVDETYQMPFGETRPLQPGMTVLVGFIRNTQEKPVILNCFHNIEEDIGETNLNNILTSTYPLEDEVDMLRYTKISRVQDVLTVDGQGNFEASAHSKAFFIGTAADKDWEHFDYDDLSTKDKRNPDKTVGIPEGNSPPLTYLGVVRSAFNDEETNWLRILLNAVDTSIRLSKQTQEDSKESEIAIMADGAVRLRRQLESMAWDAPRGYTEVSIAADGSLNIKVNDKTTFTISKDGNLSIQQTGTHTIASQGDVSISSQSNTRVSAAGTLTLVGRYIHFSTDNWHSTDNLTKIVSQDIQLQGAVAVTGNQTTSGSMTINGRTAVKRLIQSAGAANFNGSSFTVTPEATLNGGVSITGTGKLNGDDIITKPTTDDLERRIAAIEQRLNMTATE